MQVVQKKNNSELQPCATEFSLDNPYGHTGYINLDSLGK